MSLKTPDLFAGILKKEVRASGRSFERCSMVLLLSPRLTGLTLVQDSHTSRFLYEKCLQGPLLANRTVVRLILVV
jgi:hypothetical protein